MENYIEQLTAKNSEYVHVITRELVKLGKSDEEIKTVLSDILPQIIDAQNQRILAKDLLGTPSEFTAQYAPKQASASTDKTAASNNDNETPVLMWLDSSLLMLGILALINGIMAIFNKNTRTYGFISIIVMSFAAGLVMYLMFRLVYKPQSQGKKVSSFKNFATLFFAFLGWILIFSLSVLIPQSINISPTGYVTALIGVVALGIRYVLKRHYHIKSALSTQATTTKK